MPDLSRARRTRSQTRRRLGSKRPVQHRIIGVFGAMGDTAAAKLAGDFAGAGVEHGADLVGALAGFAQDGLANDRVHVGFAQVDPHLKAAEQLLEVFQFVQGLLAGADEQQAAVEIGGEAFGDVLHVERAAGVVLEELLDFVEHDEGQRQFLAAEQKRPADG